MPSKRVPIARATRPRITAEIVALYRRGLRLEGKYRQCVRDPCGRTTFCQTCEEFLLCSTELHRKLNLQLWHNNVLDDGGPLPGQSSEEYQLVRSLREQLEAAVAPEAAG